MQSIPTSQNWRRQLAVVLLMLAPEGAAAETLQEPPPAGETLASPSAEGLREQDAVRLALSRNPTLRAFRKQQNIADGQIVSAAVVANPTLSFGVLHLQEKDPARMTWNLGLKWVPPQPVELTAHRAQARAHLDEVRHQIAELERALAGSVRITYATLLELSEQTRIYERALAVRQSILGLVRTKLLRGETTRLELNLMELSILRAQAELDDVALRRAQAQAQLRGLLGLAGSEPIVLAGSTAGEAGAAEPPDPALLTERALSIRPMLQAAYARIAQRNQQVRIEKARRWPWIELWGAYRHNPANYRNDVRLGIDLSLPIFNRNSGPLQVAEAELDHEQAVVQAQVESLRQGIYAACDELKVRRTILQRLRREVMPILEERERLMALAARGSAVDLVALFSSEESVLRGRREYGEARLAYRRAWLALEASVGSPPLEEGVL